ncbi:MAG: response regulator transcription factor [Sulfuricella sp.]|nr:response regulator transcription factor [Sulfuricella sp.]
MRILIVEDDEVLLDGLCQAMRHSGHAVDCVGNGKDAVHVLQGEVYDLVILDLGLPKLDGFSVLRNLRGHNQTVPVIILTARESVDDRVKGLDLGADDYMTKPFSLPELEARVRALLRRGQCGANPLITCGALAYDSVGRRVTLNGERLELTSRETGVLEILLSRAGRVVSKDQLIEHLYSYAEEATGNAIEVYIHRLRKKVEAAGVTIRTIRGLGYLMDKASNG